MTAAPPPPDLSERCYFCGGSGIGPHPGCPGGNTLDEPTDKIVARWYTAFERVSGLEATTADGKRAIYEQFRSLLSETREASRP